MTWKLLSQAAIGWEKESVLQRDLLMEEIRNVVTRILNEFEVDNLSLFADPEKSFSRFLQEETRRAKTVEKRVLQTAQGQAKTEQARNTINQLIKSIAPLPTAVVLLLPPTIAIQTLLYGSAKRLSRPAFSKP